MCIIIDTNVLGAVFNIQDKSHFNYEPVLEWIFNGHGKVVYGGTKYFDEIRKYNKIFKLLRDIKKAVYIDNDKVDSLTNKASLLIEHRDFDDQHLVGLLLASGCKLICTKDERAIPFMQNRTFFKKSKEPKIYLSKRNIKLLNPKYIAECCGCSSVSTNYQKGIIKTMLESLQAG